MKTFAIALGLCASLIATAASAMTVQEFLTTANGIPRNPIAPFRSDTRNLISEFRTAMQTVKTEQAEARAAGRPGAACIPDKVRLSPDQILARFNAIPAARRNISVTQATREWMIETYPCPA